MFNITRLSFPLHRFPQVICWHLYLWLCNILGYKFLVSLAVLLSDCHCSICRTFPTLLQGVDLLSPAVRVRTSFVLSDAGRLSLESFFSLESIGYGVQVTMYHTIEISQSLLASFYHRPFHFPILVMCIVLHPRWNCTPLPLKRDTAW